MAEEETKKVEVAEVAKETPPPPPSEAMKEVPIEKEVKADDSKALALVEKVADPAPAEKNASANRDAVLARVETEKRMSLIKAWEENEKTKAENKAVKKMSSITAWENSKKAAIEAELKKMEETLEKKKAEYAEKMKNKIAILHKEAEEKRAMIEAKRGEEVLKAEEMAAKYRVTGLPSKKIFGCFGA